MLLIGFPVAVADGVDLGMVMTETLKELDMLHKEAWLSCEMDGASWSRMLRGQAPMDLWKLRRLGTRFALRFWGRYLTALAEQRLQEVTQEFHMLKAEIRPEKKERAS